MQQRMEEQRQMIIQLQEQAIATAATTAATTAQATVVATANVARLTALETRVPDTVNTQELQEGLAAMNARMAIREAADAARGPGGNGGNDNNATPPYENRTLARIGNLGWDSTPELLKERFAEIMTLVNILPAEYDIPVAPHRGGSHVDVQFASSEILQRGKLRAMNLNKSYMGPEGIRPRYVWIDARKTRDEMRPARLTHRAHKFLETIIGTKFQGTAVEKDIMGKRVKVANKVVCFSLRGELQLTPDLDQYLVLDERQQLVAYAESN